MRSKLRRVKNELSIVLAQINEIQNIIGHGVKMEDAVISLQNRLTQLNKKFSSRLETVVKDLTNIANIANIEIVLMNPGKVVDYQQGGQTLKLEGAKVLTMPLEMNIKATYKDFGTFLERISSDDLSGLIVVTNLTMQKPREKLSILDIYLKCNIYFILKQDG